MLKENKKTLKQIDGYIKNRISTCSRGFGKSRMILGTMQINYGLELYKDIVKSATEYIPFEQVLNLVVDAIYQADKENEEDD